jgi:hypothetical protein
MITGSHLAQAGQRGRDISFRHSSRFQHSALNSQYRESG